MDEALLKCITITGENFAAHGSMQSKYEEKTSHFISTVPSSNLDDMKFTSWKTICDRSKKIVEEHRVNRRRNERATGIGENSGTREKLLEDLLREIDENEETVRERRDENGNGGTTETRRG